MAKKQAGKRVETIIHNEASRKNIPTAEFQSVMRQDEQDPIQVAYDRRNRDLDPQLVWRGKDEQDWSDLVVHARPSTSRRRCIPRSLLTTCVGNPRPVSRRTGPASEVSLMTSTACRMRVPKLNSTSTTPTGPTA